MIASKFFCVVLCVAFVWGGFVQMLLAKPANQTKITNQAKPTSPKTTQTKSTQAKSAKNASPASKSTQNQNAKSTPKNTQKSSAKTAPKSNSKDSSLKFTLTQLELQTNTNQTTQSPHSLFVGAGLGYGVEIQTPKNPANTKDTISMLDIGFRSGYEYMPLAYIGLRVYLEYFLGVRPSGLESDTSSTFLANLNAQGRIYAFKQGFEFGWLGGLSVGYGMRDKQISSSEDSGQSTDTQGRGVFLGNVGVFGIIDKHHRVEALAKLPIKTFAQESKMHDYEDYSFLLMYDYLF